MPIFLLIFGIVLIDVAFRNTYSAFFGTLKDIIIGQKGKIAFWQWGLAIFIVAALGYWKTARPVAVSFIILIFIIMLLSNNSKALTAINKVTAEL